MTPHFKLLFISILLAVSIDGNSANTRERRSLEEILNLLHHHSLMHNNATGPRQRRNASTPASPNSNGGASLNFTLARSSEGRQGGIFVHRDIGHYPKWSSWSNPNVDTSWSSHHGGVSSGGSNSGLGNRWSLHHGGVPSGGINSELGGSLGTSANSAITIRPTLPLPGELPGGSTNSGSIAGSGGFQPSISTETASDAQGPSRPVITSSQQDPTVSTSGGSLDAGFTSGNLGFTHRPQQVPSGDRVNGSIGLGGVQLFIPHIEITPGNIATTTRPLFSINTEVPDTGSIQVSGSYESPRGEHIAGNSGYGQSTSKLNPHVSSSAESGADGEGDLSSSGSREQSGSAESGNSSGGN